MDTSKGRVYEGRRLRDGVLVLVHHQDGSQEQLDPQRSLAVVNHSPDGFEWGYGGSGPAQLALAILLDLGLAPDHADSLHQSFKWAYIAPAGRDGFALTEDTIRTWMAGLVAGRNG